GPAPRRSRGCRRITPQSPNRRSSPRRERGGERRLWVRQAEPVNLAPDPDDVLELFLGFWISRTVMAAVELGVFEVLGDEKAPGGLSLEEAQATLGLAARPARALLDTCVATRLLEKADGRYRNAPLAARFLAAGSEYSVRHYVLDERW